MENNNEKMSDAELDDIIVNMVRKTSESPVLPLEEPVVLPEANILRALDSNGLLNLYFSFECAFNPVTNDFDFTEFKKWEELGSSAAVIWTLAEGFHNSHQLLSELEFLIAELTEVDEIFHEKTDLLLLLWIQRPESVESVMVESFPNIVRHYLAARMLSLHGSSDEVRKKVHDFVIYPIFRFINRLSESMESSHTKSELTEQTFASMPDLSFLDNKNTILLEWEPAESSQHYNDSVVIEPFRDETQVEDISRVISRDLSEPYSIYTYRYFIQTWPHLCFLAKDMETNDYVGAIVCKMDTEPINAGYIAMLAVNSGSRRRGIGSRLVRQAIAAMHRLNCVEIFLETEVTNEKALQLYSSLGFVRESRQTRYYLNGVDAYRLKLPLMLSSLHRRSSITATERCQNVKHFETASLPSTVSGPFLFDDSQEYHNLLDVNE